MILEIHTDGACSGNQNDNNLGGWGCILRFNNIEKELFGGEVNTTNNRMELTALLKALEAIKKEEQEIHIYSDSAYLINCFRDKWYINWQRNGWLNSAKKPVENQDLWQAIIPYLNKHSFTFFKVKGHINLNSKNVNKEKLLQDFQKWNGSYKSMENFIHAVIMNNRADALANKGIDLVRD